MEDVGIVTEVGDGTATVAVRPHGGCSSCRNKGGGCTGEGRHVTVLAENRAGAAPGDRVTLEMNAASTIASALMMFLMPLLLLAAGYAAGAQLLGLPWGGVGGVIAGGGLSIGILYFANRAAAKSRAFRPVIVRVEERGQSQ
jgi:sigma-E factor negative regulatory protein RseC